MSVFHAVVLVLALVVGVLIGFVGPSFVQLYRISQYAYGKGFENGRATYGALIRRAEEGLACPHAPQISAGSPVCRACAEKVRAILRRCSIGPV